MSKPLRLGWTSSAGYAKREWIRAVWLGFLGPIAMFSFPLKYFFSWSMLAMVDNNKSLLSFLYFMFYHSIPMISSSSFLSSLALRIVNGKLLGFCCSFNRNPIVNFLLVHLNGHSPRVRFISLHSYMSRVVPTHLWLVLFGVWGGWE